jgi:oxaloacetate decarboxylase beta subunit
MLNAFFESIGEMAAASGLANMSILHFFMIALACFFLYLAIAKGFEPLLLIPIAFGMLLANLPLGNMMHPETWDHIKELQFHDLFDGAKFGLLDLLYLGVKLGVYPPLIFLGIGAMTDFGPLIANPKSLLLGAAAQIGIFVTFFGAIMLGFTPQEAGSIAIIGGADGPTAIFTTTKLAPHLLGPIALAAYSYMALVPVIQPPIMKLLTTKKERVVVMEQLRPVSKTEKIVFPIIVAAIVSLIIPDATPLVGMLMLGNLFKEAGVVNRLSDTAQNALINIVTIFLGVSVGATASADKLNQPGFGLMALKIIVLGMAAFAVSTATGTFFGKVMYWITGGKVNPLIGSAGVSAVPMAARVSQKVGQEYNPSNFLLMHAMGPNVAGVIGSAVAAGVLISMLGQ